MRGRDKAPPRLKAEAKARRYQPIIKMVDDWPPQHAPRLTGFRGTRSRHGSDRYQNAGSSEPDGLAGRPIETREMALAGRFRLGSDQQEVDQCDQGRPDAGSDQGIIGAEV